MHLKIKTWCRTIFLIPCHHTKKATLGFCYKVFIYLFYIAVSGQLVCSCSNFHFASDLLIKAALQRPGRQPLLDASSLGALWVGPSTLQLFAVQHRGAASCGHTDPFSWVSSWLKPPPTPEAENAAFHIYFSGNPCSVALGFLFRLHQRLRMSSKCCCCQSPVSTLQHKTTQLNSKWHKSRLLSNRHTFPPAFIASLDMVPSQLYS